MVVLVKIKSKNLKDISIKKEENLNTRFPLLL